MALAGSYLRNLQTVGERLARVESDKFVSSGRSARVGIRSRGWLPIDTPDKRTASSGIGASAVFSRSSNSLHPRFSRLLQPEEKPFAST